MSFITRCPACSTSFKVVADQLRVSQGWVRCGHCAEIFDANQDIKPWVPTPPVLTNVVDELQQPPAHAWDRHVRAPEAVSNDSPLDGVLDGLAQFTESPAQPDNAALLPIDELGQGPVATDLPIDVLQADGDEVLNAVPVYEPHFVQQAQRRSFWAQPRVLGMLWTGIALAASLLAVQWAVYDRDRLVAWQPALKPLLEAVCQPLGCRIGPSRQIEAVVIDGSGLERLLGQLHALDVVLKNTHRWPVAVPALELSLTDGQENVLARRVLTPNTWPGAPLVLAPQESLPVKLRLSIALPEGQTMAGYRIALFYP
jgi:predicted Zn finger-like uncharacterized protein